MNYLIIDLEATCVEPKDNNFINEIIEVGAILTNENWNNMGEFDMFVKPVINPTLTEFCTTLTTIKQSDVDNASGFDSVMKEFYYWIGSHMSEFVIFCSWGKYDWNQMVKDCTYHNVPFHFKPNHINLKEEVAKTLKHKRKGVGGTLRRLGLEFEGVHHRGMDDCRNILKICKHVNLKIGE